jgi:hypothetical protein
MSEPTIFTVAPDPLGGWMAVPPEGETMARRFRTKAEALHAAVREAEKAQRAHVVIKGRDGRVQSERTYGTEPPRTGE